MIKEAEVQNAYLLGRQEAMEKVAILLPLIANYMGAEEARDLGNKKARMSFGGVMAPYGYTLAGIGAGGLAGGLVGAGIGAGMDAYKDANDPAQYSLGLGAIGGIGGGVLGGIGGSGYGLYRAYKIPGEM